MSKGATVTKLHSPAMDKAAEALQLVLRLPLPLTAEVRTQLQAALEERTHEPWSFVMVGQKELEEAQRVILKGPRPGTTLAVWNAAIIRASYPGGRLEAPREDLADLAGTTPDEVSRAMSRLSSIGLLRKLGPGRYSLQPGVAWRGTLASRAAALEELHPA